MADGKKTLAAKVTKDAQRRRILRGGMIKYRAVAYYDKELEGLEGEIFTIHFFDPRSGTVQGSVHGTVFTLAPVDRKG